MAGKPTGTIVVDAVDETGKVIKSISVKMNKLGDKAKKASTKASNASKMLKKALLGAAKGAKKFIGKLALAPLRAFGSALKNISTIILGMLGYQGFRAIGRSIANMVEEAGPIQSVRTQFANFMQQANAHIPDFNTGADEMIAKMQGMTGGALDVTRMLKASNLAFSLIGERVGKDLPRMLGVAQAASLTTGESIERMFNSLVKGVGRLSTRWLDNLGITVSTTEAYGRYADENDLVASNLSHTHRVQAMLNAAMEQGEKIMMRTGDVQAFLSTQMSALNANFLNTRDSVINAFAPLATTVLMFVNDMTSQVTPKVEDFATAFAMTFAKIPPSAYASAQNTVAGLTEGMNLVEPVVLSAQERMGERAANWAVNALSWGANVGAQFVSGIIQGFSALIAGAMNYISAVLASWLRPGSPPKVSPQIDNWGYGTMESWVEGMLDYPVDPVLLPKIKGDLKDVFESGVKDSLFQWGADSIAEWAEGLSIIDMDFLSQAIEEATVKAKILNKELTSTYKEQRTELFKLRVLNRDPKAIRAQQKRVKTSKNALKTNEKELEQLENRRKLIREQLELLRLLERALKDMERTSKRGGGGGRGGGGDGAPGLDDIPAPELPLVGTSSLESQITGLKERLKEIFGEPLQQVADSFSKAADEIGLAWGNLRTTIEENSPAIKEKSQDAAKSIGSFFAEANKQISPALQDLKQAFIDAAPEFLKAGDSAMKFAGLWRLAGKVYGFASAMIAKLLAIQVRALGRFASRMSEKIDGLKMLFSRDLLGGLRRIFFSGASDINTWPEFMWAMLKRGFMNSFDFPSMFTNVFTNLFKPGVIKFLDSARGLIKRVFGEAAAESSSDWSATWGSAAVESGSAIVQGVADGVSQGATGATNSANQFASGLQSQFATEFDPSMYSVYGENIAIGIGDGLTSGGSDANLAMEEMYNQFLKTTESSVGSGEESPYSQYGSYIPDGISQGIESNAESANMTLEEMYQNFLDTSDASLGTGGAGSSSTVFNDYGQIMPTSVRDGIMNNQQAAWDQMGNMWQGVIDTTDSYGEPLTTSVDTMTSSSLIALELKIPQFKSSGEALIQGLIDGIIGKMPEAESAVKDAADKVSDAASSAWDISSPSGVFEKMGNQLMSGTQKGIQDKAYVPMRAMQRAAGGVISAGPGATGGNTNNTTTIVIQGPIIETMSVPNMRVGREMSRQIGRDLSNMASMKRSPA